MGAGRSGHAGLADDDADVPEGFELVTSFMLSARRHQLSTSTLQRVLSVLRRAIGRAEARVLVGRNVALLSTAPTGKGGRPSKSMTLDQARALLVACHDSPLGAYVILGMLIGARNQELRALTWDHVNLEGDPATVPTVRPRIRVWRSVRERGDTKTRLSRRTSASLLRPSRAWTITERRCWRPASTRRAAPSSARARRRRSMRPTSELRNICAKAGLEPGEWTPRELATRSCH